MQNVDRHLSDNLLLLDGKSIIWKGYINNIQGHND